MAEVAQKNSWNFVKQKFTCKETVASGCSLSDDVSPELCIRLLNTPSIRNFFGLKTKFNNSSKDWLEEFVSRDGMCVLFNALERLGRRGQTSFFDTLLQLECVNCIKVVLNSKAGLDSMTENPKLTDHLVGGGKPFCSHLLVSCSQ